MMRHHPVTLADGSQVVDAIPLFEEIEIALEAFDLRLAQRDPERLDAARERGFAHAALCSVRAALFAPRRFKCTSNSEIAAGVTPAMRDAWPTVSGRCCASFCCTSIERPRTVR